MKFFNTKFVQLLDTTKRTKLEIIFNNVLGDYAVMLPHSTVRTYGPKYLPILVTNLVYAIGYAYISCFYLISNIVFN